MPAPDIGSLALVLDDPLAPKLLALWQAEEPTFESVTDCLDRWAALLQAPSASELSLTIARCKLAGLIQDGGVSVDAKTWITHLVAQRLGYKPKPVKAPKVPKPPKALPA